MNAMSSITAVAVLAGLTSVPAAMGAEATVSLNVRSGPSTAYSVVDVLYAGENVDVEQCRSSGWCYVTHSGPDGWVSARYLTGERFTDDEDDDRVVVRRPNVTFSFSFGRGNGFSIGTPPRGSMRDLVCLVTFQNRSQVAGGADADVVSARVMSRSQAEAIDRPNDRRAIYDYGTNAQTRQTCHYLDNLN